MQQWQCSSSSAVVAVCSPGSVDRCVLATAVGGYLRVHEMETVSREAGSRCSSAEVSKMRSQIIRSVSASLLCGRTL
jgi:hypothetical protein